MPYYEFRLRNAFFRENGPETTNLRWGIERILGLYGLDHSGENCKDCIIALEKYFQVVGGLFGTGVELGHDHTIPPLALLDMCAQEANVEFPEEAPYR